MKTNVGKRCQIGVSDRLFLIEGFTPNYGEQYLVRAVSGGDGLVFGWVAARECHSFSSDRSLVSTARSDEVRSPHQPDLLLPDGSETPIVTALLAAGFRPQDLDGLDEAALQRLQTMNTVLN